MPLARFIVRRLLTSLGAVLGAALLVFAMRHLVPGDPVAMMAGEQADEHEKARVRACLDLDKPLSGQLRAFARDLATLDFGHSCAPGREGDTVARLVRASFPWTLELAIAAMVVALLCALPLGITAALKAGGPLDAGAMGVSLLGICIPTMWLGPILILVFYIRLQWLPGPGDDPHGLAALVLPAVTLGTHLMAMLSRMTRSSLLEVLGEDYILTARAKGLPPWLVVLKHALRNALAPVITVAGIQFGALLAGAIITEKIFARPGLGTLILDAIASRDWKVIQGCVLVVAVSYVLINLLVDLAYGLADPRIRVKE
ncbi:MAG TPA: ABC transporter permease [Polyangia bacterium]